MERSSRTKLGRPPVVLGRRAAGLRSSAAPEETPMKRPLLALPLAVLAAACAPGDTEGLKKDVSDLRADLQKAQGENRKLAGRVEEQERRISGLAEDLASARQMSFAVKEAPAPS